MGWGLVLSAFCLAAVTLPAAFTAVNVPPNELSALYDLFVATNGTSWRWSNLQGGVAWDFSVPDPNPCVQNWQGVACACIGSTSCNVFSLVLPSHQLDGQLTSSLANLTHLALLNLGNNRLQGPIPNSLTSISNLSVLDLSSNFLNGTAPQSFRTLLALSFVNVSWNDLEGVVSDFIAPNLSTLSAFSNVLVGPLPHALCELRNLTVLELENNILMGGVPSCLSNLSGSLERMTLGFNFLNGTVPASLCGLLHLEYLSLTTSFLSGSIPPCIGNLTSLTRLYLEGNFLTGVLPESVGQMTSLEVLSVARNYLHSTLPASLGNATRMTKFDAFQNHFVGTVPVTLRNWTELRVLLLSNNLLEGSLYESIQGFPYMQIFQISNNFFTGSLFANAWPLLGQIGVVFNFLDGPLLEPFNGSTPIVIAEFSHNLFSGTISDLYGAMTSMTHFTAQNNHLDGSIPAGLLNLTVLNQLLLQSNLLTGTFPATNSGQASLLAELNVSSNLLHGTIPRSLANISILLELDLSSNSFSGSIPREISTMPNLQVLFLSNNRLSGNLYGIVNASLQPELLDIDVSHNQLSGSVPSEVFLLRTLRSFSAAVNCLEGTIPSEVCVAQHMTALVLDGATTALYCRSYIFEHAQYLNSYALDGALHGTIPACIFEMVNMTSLHLSGNQFTGQLPSNFSSHLRLLSLSNNLLDGTIPPSLQTMGLQSLDLSYNRFSGHLSSDIAVPPDNGNLVLEVNRLSGGIPRALRSAPNVDILNGNLFRCDAARSELPRSDPYKDKYDCASDAVDRSVYILLLTTLAGALAVVGLLMSWSEPREGRAQDKTLVCSLLFAPWDWGAALREGAARLRSALHDYWQFREEFVCRGRVFLVIAPSTSAPSVTAIVVNHSVAHLLAFFGNLRRRWGQLALVLALMLTPTYVLLSVLSSTYENVYGWSVSAVLLEGTAATVVLFVAFLLAMALFATAAWAVRSAPPPTRSEPTALRGWTLLDRHRAAHLLVVATINLAVMVAVDCAYVYIVLNCDSGVVFVVQMLMALFKVLWNEEALWAMLPFFKQRLLVPRPRSVASTDGLGSSTPDRRARSASALQPSATIGRYACYSTGFVHADEAGAIVTEEVVQIDAFEPRCADEGRRQFDSVELPFLAFTTLLNNIVVPAVAIASISSTCFNNALVQAPSVDDRYTILLCSIYREATTVGVFRCTGEKPTMVTVTYDPPFIYSYQCASNVFQNFTEVFVYMFAIVGIAVPLAKLALKHAFGDGHGGGQSQHQNQSGTEAEEEGKGESGNWGCFVRAVAARLPEVLRPVNAESEGRTFQLFKKEKTVVRLVAYMGILLVFGVVYPPLLAISALAIFSLLAAEEYLLATTLRAADRQGFVWYRLQLLADAEGTEELFLATVWQVAPFAFATFAYLLFDTAGYVHGWRFALIPALLMLLGGPVLLYAYSVGLVAAENRTQRPGRAGQASAEGHELSSMPSLSALVLCENPLHAGSTETSMRVARGSDATDASANDE